MNSLPHTPYEQTQFEKLLSGLLGIRFAVLAVSAFLPLSFPDVWRQVVTLGVSMRYWSRWTLETGTQHLLLPAVLDAADTSGIMPMEFPILNLLLAPCFGFGPRRGRGLAVLLYTALMFGMVIANAQIWKGKKIAQVDAYPAMLLLPLFSLGAWWSGKFMPDFMSILWVTMAIGTSWGARRRPLMSFVFATLGMLMKPTAVIVLLIYLVLPAQKSEYGDSSSLVKKFYPIGLWLIPALGVVAAYYTFGIKYMSLYQSLPDLVGIRGRSLSFGFVSFFDNIPFILKFYFERAFFLGGILLVLGVTFWSQRVRNTRFPGILWLISILQFFTVTVLDGGSLFHDHYYYLLGLCPILCLLFVDAFQKCEWKPLRTVFIFGLLAPLIEISSIDLKTLYRHPQEPIWTLDRQVEELKIRNPNFPWRRGLAFRSTPEPFPMLGMYFGEIQGSLIAKYGFFYREEALPADCRAVDQTVLLILAKCGA